VELTARALQLESIQSHSNGYNGGDETDWTKQLRALLISTHAMVKLWVILTPKNCFREVDVFAQTLAKVLHTR